jgi:hypothetical protein
VDLPATLPARLYLLAYDRQKRRIRGGGHLGLALRAAALADLYLTGHLVDERGKAHTAIAPKPTDPILQAVLEQVEASTPRRWTHWIAKHAGRTPRAVRDELERSGWLHIEPRRILGIIPADQIGLRQEHQVARLMTDATNLIRSGQLVSRLDRRQTTLVALATTAGLPTVMSGAERRQYKARLAEFGDQVGPVIPALRKAIQSEQAAAAGG